MKAAIAESFNSLVRQRGIDKVTVKAVIEDCGISRQTFYYHFQDIYDLLSWTFRQEALSLIHQSDSCLTWEDGIRLFLRYVRDNAAVCRSAINSLGQESLRRMFHEEAAYLMRAYLLEIKGERQVPEGYLDFLTDFYMEALSGLVMQWLQRGMDVPEETLLHYLHLTLEGTFDQAFRRVQEEERGAAASNA